MSQLSLVCPGIWGFRKEAKPDFCFSELSYYYEHPRIQKAIYGSDSTLVNKVDEVFRNRWRTLLSVDEMVDKECAHRILNCYLSNSSSGFTNFPYRFLYFCWVLGHFSKPTIWQMRLTRAR